MEAYTVMPGDTMWQIASKYGINLSNLIAANPQIINSTLIYPGQIINIPITDKSTYTVMPGDTMWSIADKQGIGLDDLLTENPQITNPTLIYPGQSINIPDGTDIPSAPDDIRPLEKEVIRIVNEERRNAGQSALIENTEVSNVARIKSKDFVNNNYFAHNSPTYGSPFDMLRDFGITFTAAGENIASGQRTAEEVMNYWMNSSGHRENILNSAYNQIGVGVTRDNNGNLYWTQMFIRS